MILFQPVKSRIRALTLLGTLVLAGFLCLGVWPVFCQGVVWAEVSGQQASPAGGEPGQGEAAPPEEPSPSGTPAPAEPVPGESPLPAETPAVPSEYAGTEACKECHEEEVQRIGLTPHGKLQTDRHAVTGCEACHGPGQAHVDSGGEDAMLRPESKGCLGCHDDQVELRGWRFTQHAANDVSCTSCHDPHLRRPEVVGPGSTTLLSSPGTELCLRCHVEKAAEIYLPSRHPIAEGRMECTSCHNPHGSGLTAFRSITARETCLSCHAQYRGPFLVEHQPVAEDCGLCHQPHGSVEDNLLVQGEPFLCMQCHNVFHNPHTLAGGMPIEDVTANVFQFSRCSACHPQTHGTDQTLRFTR